MIEKYSAAATIRHEWPDRFFHWSMALTVLVLLFSSLLPIIGIQFDWIPWHWIAGVCLTILLLFHIIRASFVQGLSSMLPVWDDVRELVADSTGIGKDSQHPSLAKYDAYQKSYHWTVAIIVLALVVTGLLMLMKLDTVFWNRNPSILSDIQWGYIYVIHGLATLMLIFLVLLHVYFSLLPEHKQFLVAMITGRGPQHARETEPQ